MIANDFNEGIETGETDSVSQFPELAINYVGLKKLALYVLVPCPTELGLGLGLGLGCGFQFQR